ncbi:MAG TPA: DMT family transporter [Verrucomicrobiae bacterium]|jgi:drug/metabolite transporter (DMT)-like permease|nr:DMT family transporter [Verrucomicrobiae bacterium]
MNHQLPPAPRALSIVDLGSLLFLGAVWGAAFLFLRIAAPEVGPAWAAEIRLVVGAAVLVVVAGPRTLRAARGRMISFLIAGALFSAVPFTLIAFATVTLPAGFTALLNAATPLFTAAIAVVFLGHRLGLQAVAGLGVGVVAVVILVGWSPLEPGAATILAVAAGLGAPASYALAGNYVRAKMARVEPLELATGMLVAGSILALPVALLSGAPRTPALDGVVSLVGVGVLSTAVAWPIFFRVLRRTTPTAASTVTFIVPAFALTWGSLVLAEPVGLGLLVGFGLIAASLALVLGLVPSAEMPVLRRLARTARVAAARP